MGPRPRRSLGPRRHCSGVTAQPAPAVSGRTGGKESKQQADGSPKQLSQRSRHRSSQIRGGQWRQSGCFCVKDGMGGLTVCTYPAVDDPLEKTWRRGRAGAGPHRGGQPDNPRAAAGGQRGWRVEDGAGGASLLPRKQEASAKRTKQRTDRWARGRRSCREAGGRPAVCAALRSRSSARHGAGKLESWAKPCPWLCKEGAAQGEGAQR